MSYNITDYKPYDFANRRHIGPSPLETTEMLNVVGANDLDDLIKNAFNLQVRTDTKLGVNLSSGVDSQLMLSVLNNINGGQKNIQAN